MDRASAEDFLYREARLLDQGKYREWHKLLADDAIYWIPVNDANSNPQEHCSIIYENPVQLADRITRSESTHYWVGDPPVKTLHAISNVTVDELENDQVCVESNMIFYSFREGDHRREIPLDVLPAQCEHHLAKVDGSWKIKFKKITLLNLDGLLPSMAYLM